MASKVPVQPSLPNLPTTKPTTRPTTEPRNRLAAEKHPPKRTKRSQIVALYGSGVTEIQELAHLTSSKPSYVASVLQESGLISGYFDLYTHTANPMNVYSSYFSGKLGFRDEATARRSVDLLARMYDEFREGRDRAGQHHALEAALTMFDRARWCGKRREAEIYRKWLVKHLYDDDRAPQRH